MLKTVTAFQIVDQSTRDQLSEFRLNRRLPEATAADPAKTMWAAAGFSHPPYFGALPVFVSADGTRVLNVQIRERVLPAKVIKSHLAERMADAEKRQGYAPNRKMIAELKELVTSELLPNSHIKPVDIPVVITSDYVLIGTSSAKQVDTVIALLSSLVTADDEQPPLLRPIAAKRDVTKFLVSLLVYGTTDSCNFKSSMSVTLKGADKSVARYKDVDLESESVQDSVADGMQPVELSMTFGDPEQINAAFALTDQMLIKRLKFSDILIKSAAEEADEGVVGQFDATVALVAGELRKLLDALCDEIPVEDDGEL